MMLTGLLSAIGNVGNNVIAIVTLEETEPTLLFIGILSSVLCFKRQSKIVIVSL